MKQIITFIIVFFSTAAMSSRAQEPRNEGLLKFDQQVIKAVGRGRFIAPKDKANPTGFGLTATQLVHKMGWRQCDHSRVAATLCSAYKAGQLEVEDGVLVLV